MRRGTTNTNPTVVDLPFLRSVAKEHQQSFVYIKQCEALLIQLLEEQKPGSSLRFFPGNKFYSKCVYQICLLHDIKFSKLEKWKQYYDCNGCVPGCGCGQLVGMYTVEVCYDENAAVCQLKKEALDSIWRECHPEGPSAPSVSLERVPRWKRSDWNPKWSRQLFSGTIPSDVIRLIGQYLPDVVDAVCATLVSKQWYQALNKSNEVWYRRCQRDFRNQLEKRLPSPKEGYWKQRYVELYRNSSAMMRCSIHPHFPKHRHIVNS